MGLRETITIRPYEEGDETAILLAFERTRTPADARVEAHNLERWRWLYRENPCGTRIMLALDDGGAVLAHYAGLPLRARIQGRPVLFCRVVDALCARPADDRQVRRGLFTACAESFRDTFGGTEAGQHVFSWDLPGGALRVGRTLGYRFLREGYAHVLDLGTETGGDYRVEVREVERFGPEAAELFERIAIDAQAIVVRDALYLNWRFARAHAPAQACAVAYEGARPAGLAVWRPGTVEGLEGGLVCEWMVPRDEPRAATSLLAWLAAKTRAAGAAHLVAIAAPFSREWMEFQHRGFRVQRVRHAWTGQSHSRAHPARFFAHHLHVTLSDTGFA